MHTTSPFQALNLLQQVQEELKQVDVWIDGQLQQGPEEIRPLLDYVAQFRGKRLRAAQVCFVAKACNAFSSQHVEVAGILEMMHSATLVHDDVLDNARERRKLDCFHVQWGTHTAVLLGDWLYSQAFLASTKMEDATASKVLAAATGRVCVGEMHQNLTRRSFDLAESVYLQQIDGKTAALFEAGAELAAYYAGAPASLCAAAKRYGLLAGRAFQIVDDILDLAGDETEVGKSLGTDWQRGKMTMPLIRLRDALSPSHRQELEALFAAGGSREVLQQEPFASAFAEAMESSQQVVSALLAESTALLSQFPNQEVAQDLAELTLFLGSRRA